jgi:hypothetical protein
MSKSVKNRNLPARPKPVETVIEQLESKPVEVVIERAEPKPVETVIDTRPMFKEIDVPAHKNICEKMETMENDGYRVEFTLPIPGAIKIIGRKK